MGQILMGQARINFQKTQSKAWYSRQKRVPGPLSLWSLGGMLMTEAREAEHLICSIQLTLKHGVRSLAQPELRDEDRLTNTNVGM